MKKYIITHYQRKSPNPHGYSELVFIVKDSEGNFYIGNTFFGFIDEDWIERQKIYRKLETSFETTIDLEKRLWMSPTGDVYFSSKEDLFSDKKVLI